MPRLISTFFLLLTAAVHAYAGDFVCSGVSKSVAASPAAKAAGHSQIHSIRDEAAATKGKVNALLIFTRFSDEAADTAPPFAGDIFDLELPGSLSHFYRAMSFGQFELSGTVMSKRYVSRQPASAYTQPDDQNRGGFGRFVLEILEQVDRDIDLGQFDNDGPDGIPNSGDDDGFVDYVFVNPMSTPQGFITAAATGVAALGLDDDYVSSDIGAEDHSRILVGSSRGALQQEGTFSQTVGVMAHEFGHWLGLPDLYDLEYDEPERDSAGIGKWGLMGWGAHGWNGSDGPASFSAWSLEQLGWIGRDNASLLVVDEDREGIALDSHFDRGEILKIPLRTSVIRSGPSEDYLLLEHRRRNGSNYDRGLPADGLLVWHITPRQLFHNDDEKTKLVDLVCADGLYEDAGYPGGGIPDATRGRDNLDFWSHAAAYRRAHHGNMGDATDPFDGIRFSRLNLATNPSNNPQSLTSTASTGLSLELRPLEDAMRVDVKMPRWAGTIRETVYWSGSVRMEGDVTVDGLGNLIIDEGTRVRVAGSERCVQDRTGTGLN